jgi:hypothetical protein
LKRGLGLEITELASFPILKFSVEIIVENRNGGQKSGFVEASAPHQHPILRRSGNR